MKKHLLIFTILCFASQFLSFGQELTEINTVGLGNLHKVDEGVYRSRQPSEEQFKWLEENGVKEILNLRRYHSDDGKAKNTNLKLHRIKVRASRLNEEHLLEAMRIIQNRDGGILIHCHHGSDRTGAVVATYRIVFQDWSKEDAIEEMKNGGYGFHGIYSNLPKLIDKINVEDFKKRLSIKSEL